jgi:polyisoprenoid-binding protein YceI
MMVNHGRRQVLLTALVIVFFGAVFAGQSSYGAAPESRPLSKAPAPLLLNYKIDTSQSAFKVRTFSGGLFSIFGHNHNIDIRDFAGEIQLAPGAIDQSSLRMTVRAGSLKLTDKVDEKERQEIEQTMRTQVLDIEKYPEIVFTSTGVSSSKIAEDKYKVKISGNLSLHGVTKEIPIQAQVVMSGNNLRASGEFSLDQTAYGIKPVTAAGGTIKVKDEVKLSFNIVAHQ